MQRLQPLQNGQFGSKIKNAKYMQKAIYKIIRVLLSKKPALKKHQIFEKWDNIIVKVGRLAKGMAHAKAIAFAKWLNWV